ncbi:hypothetical protein GW17_00017479 [Ensete ventricosum]|nr:hypothetical protein GW17_00017479 [Ensete ventricosum]
MGRRKQRFFSPREEKKRGCEALVTSLRLYGGKKPRFVILTCTTRIGRYIPVRQVIDTRTARYRAVPPKIDHRWSISTVGGRLKKKSTVGGRLREKSTIGGRLRKKKGRRRGKEKKEEEKKEYLARVPSSPVCRHRPRVACASSPPAIAFSPARGDGASPRTGRKIKATTDNMPVRTGKLNFGKNDVSSPRMGFSSRLRGGVSSPCAGFSGRRNVSPRGEKE